MPQPKRIVETVDVEALNEGWNSLKPPTEKDRWAEEYSKMVRHTQGDPQCDIITARRPYEPEDVKAYRVKSFRAITKSAMTQAVNMLQRLFSKSAVDIQWPEGATEYLDGKNFDDCDFLGYINKFVVRRMVEDANGLLIWWADYPGADNVRAEPQPILLLSEDILHLTNDVLCFLSDEKSPILRRDGKGRYTSVLEGEVFYIVTARGYYKRVQYGEASKGLFRIETGLAHNLGYLPYIVLGGEEVIRAKRKSLKPERWLASFLEPCTQFGDEALAQFSDWQAVMVTSAHPMREIETIKCTADGCVKGYTYTGTGKDEKKRACSACRGQGEIVPDSPYGFIRRKEKRAGFADTGKADPIPAVRFVHPDPAILERIELAWRELIKDMKDSLHLLFVEEAQSGKAKEIDREDKVSTLDRIGQQVFDVIVGNSLEIVLQLMNYPAEYSITLPPTFKIRSEQDLRDEIKELSSPGVQPLYRGMAMGEMIRKRYPSDGYAAKSIEVIGYYDLVWGYTAQEKASLVAGMAINEEIVQRSVLVDGMLRRMAMEQGEAFLKKSAPDLAKELGALIDAQMSKEPIVVPAPEPGTNAGRNPSSKKRAA